MEFSPAFVGLSSFGARPAEAERPLAPKEDGTMNASPACLCWSDSRGALEFSRLRIFARIDVVIKRLISETVPLCSMHLDERSTI
jgi:hypothetical protein